MKPFNIEEFKAGKKAVTRDGKWEATSNYMISGADRYVLIVDMKHTETGIIANHSYMSNGKYWNFEEAHYLDLFFPSEKKSAWVVMEKESKNIFGNIYKRESEAKYHLSRLAYPEHFFVTQIHWEE